MAMVKTHSKFVCQNCGRQTLRYMGRCPGCSEFNTMVEEIVEQPRINGGKRVMLPNSHPEPLDDITTQKHPRMLVPLDEFNRVMGGGIVPGSITLIGGEPGIGKSTLIIQVSCLVAQCVGKVLYVSGEESTS